MTDRTPLPDWYDDLQGSLQAAWDALARGAEDRRSAFHHPVIATTGLDGQPRQRVMILREADPERRFLRVNTDIRSPKIAEWRADPRVAVLGYDPAQKLQIRIEGRAHVHHGDAVAAEAWNRSMRLSRICYGTAPAPGTVIGTGDGFSLPDPEIAADLAAGEAHFAAIRITVEKLEWLYLAFEGHRRAQFSWDARGDLRANWLAP